MRELEKYSVGNLMCRNMRNPRGLGQTPLFSWKLGGNGKHTFQRSYRILVTAGTKTVWDSRIVASEQTRGVPYGGMPLENGVDYRWRVYSTSNYGEQAVSEEASFTMAVLPEDFWKAKWVLAVRPPKKQTDTTDFLALQMGKVPAKERPEDELAAPVYFRREFELTKEIKSAVAYVTAHGIYDFQVDGGRVGNLLAPEYTSYAGHLEYQSYDVTQRLSKPGRHAVGAIVADGWYTGKIGLMGLGNQYGERNALLFQIRVEYGDGTKEDICSDEAVRWSEGGYVYADLFVGEYWMPQREPLGFSRPGFDDGDWRPAAVADCGYRQLKAQSVEPVTVLREITPTLITTPKGELVLDAGETICGYTSFRLTAPAGTQVGLEHSEVLDREGNFLQNITGQNKHQKDRIIAGDGETVYEPRFTFHGFRYVKVTGLSEVRPKDFIISVIGSGMERTGWFSCSDERLTRLMDNIFRSQQGNMVCIPTDCPQRERSGWTGDMQIYANAATFHMDVQSFLGRWLYDMRLEQLSDGQIPNIVPTLPSSKYVSAATNGGQKDSHVSSAGWGDACIIVPYALYQAYGDAAVLKENYEMMTRWMAYIQAHEGEDLCGWGRLFHFGDWLIPSIMEKYRSPIETALRTKEEVAMAMYAYVTELMGEIAAILGKREDCDYYVRKNFRIRERFSENYVTPEGQMRQELQGLYVLALQFGLLTEKQRKGAARNLVRLVHEAGDTLDVGFLSVPFLLEVLWQIGEKELAYRLLFQENPPSWLYAVKHGATTVWENWNAILPDGTPTDSSYNHFAFGCVSDFIVRRIGGLSAEEPGYRRVRIEPDYACGLKWADTTYDSVYGKIRICWEITESGPKLQVSLPPSVTGLVVHNKREVEIGNGEFSFE